MEAAEIIARSWAPGTDFPPPREINWMYHAGLAIICTLWTLSLSIVCLRIWGRWTAKQLGLDDALIVASVVANTVWFYSLVMYVKTKYVGIHYYDVPELSLKQQSTSKLYEWLIILLYHPVLGFVKASVLAFDRKFTGSNRAILYTVYALQAINAGSMISVFSVTLFQCKPISLNWQPGYKRSCINNLAFNYAYNGIVIATDIAVLAVPFWAFMGLQMRRRVKVALIGVFALGLIVTVVSCVRLILLVDWFRKFYAGTGGPDIYYTLGWTVSAIECNLAIIAASFPALWPLVRKCVPGYFSTASPSSYQYGKNNSHLSGNRAKAFRSSTHPSRGATRIDDDLDDDTFMMKTVKASAQSDYRSTTPTGSQDGIIDYKSGIVRTTNIDVNYEVESQDRSGYR
ncbi:uncharacterized protein DNG_09591 [Cephalotrichum gorgonifer]|uniref:Rhodopsin domain-containing protein n=1 Tax=Cephalotrichum gorgonifer TaxID=2041049 RepID=A0AAE8N8E9_9PEZI|nr:uncharacterized protein DNG_09591 [Cephalotrichum gorgonifer]